jgi:hypothetical protein
MHKSSERRREHVKLFLVGERKDLGNVADTMSFLVIGRMHLAQLAILSQPQVTRLPGLQIVRGSRHHSPVRRTGKYLWQDQDFSSLLGLSS